MGKSHFLIFGAKIQIFEKLAKLEKWRKFHPLIFGAKIQIFESIDSVIEGQVCNCRL